MRGSPGTITKALALIEERPDGAILDGNLLDGPITPVACALCDRSVPLVIFTGSHEFRNASFTAVFTTLRWLPVVRKAKDPL
jgi:hypothetical protein